MDLIHRAIDSLFWGGWVMAPLMITSTVMWALIVERLYFFNDLTRQDIHIKEAIAFIKKGKAERRLKARGLRARLVESFLKERTGNPEWDKRLLTHCRMKLEPLLTHHLDAIAVLAAVAPLLGLLGTVLGMIDTFGVIAAFGTSNIKALSGGISMALITTQSGLIIAIPGLFLSVYLYRRAAHLELRLEEIISILSRHMGNKGRLS